MMGTGGNTSPKVNSRQSSYYLDGSEEGQTFFLDRQNSLHRIARNNGEGGHSNHHSTRRLLVRKGSMKRTASGTSTASGSDLSRQPLLEHSEKGYGSSGNLIGGYGSSGNLVVSSSDLYTIRFQVVVWNIGKLDVVTVSK